MLAQASSVSNDAQGDTLLIDGTTYTSISKLTTKKERKNELVELIGVDSCEVNDYASRLLDRAAA